MPKVTPDNLSPVILIVTWLLCIYQFLTVLALFLSKKVFKPTGFAHDLPIYFASICVIVQAIVNTFRIKHGLGRNWDTLQPSQKTTFEVSAFGARTFYFFVMCLTEISVCLFIRILTPVRWHQRLISTLIALIVIWALVGIILIDTRCGLTWTPWKFGKWHCFNPTTYWQVIEAFGLILNLALVVLPLMITSFVRTKLARRLTVNSLFCLRLCVCAVLICKIIFWGYAKDNPNLSFAIWPVEVCSQVAMALSIISYCVLSLRPLFDTIDAGFIRSDELRRRGEMGSISAYTRPGTKINRRKTSAMSEEAENASDRSLAEQNGSTNACNQLESGLDGMEICTYSNETGSASNMSFVEQTGRTWGTNCNANQGGTILRTDTVEVTVVSSPERVSTID